MRIQGQIILAHIGITSTTRVGIKSLVASMVLIEETYPAFNPEKDMTLMIGDW